MNGDWEQERSPDHILRYQYLTEEDDGVEIIKRIGGPFPLGPEDPVGGSWEYSTWAYAILGTGEGWQPMPHHIETVEDAKTFALTMWRLT